ncbi:MAG: hypothetical protein RIM99_06455 [Cyclobacteriaceae bacterium]
MKDFVIISKEDFEGIKNTYALLEGRIRQLEGKEVKRKKYPLKKKSM